MKVLCLAFQAFTLHADNSSVLPGAFLLVRLPQPTAADSTGPALLLGLFNPEDD